MNEGKEYNISITTGAIMRILLLIVLFGVLYYMRDLVLVVLAAVVIASSVEPAAKWLMRYKFRRLPAVILMYLVIAGLLTCFFLFFLPSLLNETIVYLNGLPDSIRLSDIWSPVRDSGFLNGQTVDSLSNQSFSIKEIILGLRDVISGTGAGAFKTANILFGGALSFVIMIVLSFYLAVQEDGVGDFLRVVTPLKYHTYIIDLWRRSQQKIGFWMQGQLLLGIIVGVLVYLSLTIAGVQHALLLGSIAAVFELIPVFGPILSSIPAIIISTVDGGITKGVWVIAIYLIIHQFENHIFYPLVVKKIVGISPIVVILALVIGAKLAGFLGAILGVPLAAAFMEYISDIEKRKVINHHPRA